MNALTNADEVTDATSEIVPEPVLSLNAQRIASVLAILKDSRAKSVIYFGCGEGKLLRYPAKVKPFDRIVGMDVSVRSLEFASEML